MISEHSYSVLVVINVNHTNLLIFKLKYYLDVIRFPDVSLLSNVAVG